MLLERYFTDWRRYSELAALGERFTFKEGDGNSRLVDVTDSRRQYLRERRDLYLSLFLAELVASASAQA